MAISGIDATDSPFAAGQAPSKASLDKDAFLQLLVAKLKNQDPIQPTDSDEFVAQLATFSELEEMQNLNESIVSMVLLQQGNALISQLTQSTGLIGNTVEYTDPATEATRTGTVTSVKVEEGLPVLDVEGNNVPLANVTQILGDGAASDADSQ